MIKKLNSMLDIYGEQARRYDYLNRVLASFAEIYNYEISMSALIEDGNLFKEQTSCIRKSGIMGRIRAFYEKSLNEQEINTKLYYNEVMYDQEQTHEYGFLTLGNFEAPVMADMIALAVRLLEACGLRDFKVYIAGTQEIENVKNFLDCLDIEYEEKKFSEEKQSFAFKICLKNENKQAIPLISGGDYSQFCEEISGLKEQAFGFSGTIEILEELSKDVIKLDNKMLDIVLTYETKEECEYAYYLGQELRLNGFKTEIIKRCEKNFIKKFYNTKYVISVNKNDITNNELLLVDLYTNEREKVKELDLIQHLDINF